MQLTFDPIINPIILLLGISGGALAGFIIGRGKLAKTRSTIHRLESDLFHSNQETLEAQKALVALESRLNDQSIPVIPMKLNPTKENTPKDKTSKLKDL
ncbi:hypothetical protein [Puia dinghuensis]|uniref:Uncharacterized protein n=1 Tax=Puia dinghuensis TaxID=1792502 RepID=A0A8J2UH28_9BACT|nr:hypothetical protein [Puia dinghuensis]GGB14240.1 hypothetical protein GCM10011511_42540 [Puia dinghuensis]